MQKNKRRGNGGHSFRAGPYDRPQNESGGPGCGRGRGRGVVRGRRGRGGYSSYRVAVMVMGVSVSAPIMVVVEATHHTRLEVAVVVLVGVVELELEGPTSMKALVVLLTQHFGLVVRVTGAFMQPGDMTAMAENKAIKTIPTMITLNSGIDNGMERMVMAIRNMMTVNSGVSKWMRRMAMVITEMNRRLPATAAPRNEYVA
ncbi:hypothetical protein FOXG_07570 [Fusarium oxysporum f. sp. lycopersici 4287]|uniref:Uncharacterized protein n=3 Tax=Fusarium oxysporum TaxID=5507 RepID=A0A0J9V275_FUSO4|nr:hypothetical protein FOXG_07570 [Fusarium oxysporum f. sp. lycopersici 4287]EXK46038.1 hypothetical protein FOMG_04264 [Fusarium oxysporum f. sp. melonis 26406]KAJ9426218.1 hypothetical protein QL093DRAFT_1168870 [Fusarium oxysporum]KNB05228.1 hypothetical protein FOXG_07570 [Fusarium oxysporum f. sp. lycopersici 4287]